MKNLSKLFEAMRSIAIIALVAVIGFSMVGCDNGTGGGGGGGGGGGEGAGSNIVSGSDNYDSDNAILYLTYGTWTSTNDSTGQSSSGRQWSSGNGLKLADSFSLKTSATYTITISGTTDVALPKFSVQATGVKVEGNAYYAYGLGDITPAEENITAGNFTKTFTLTTHNSFYSQPYDFRNVQIRNRVSDNSITENTTATISNFSITIAEVVDKTLVILNISEAQKTEGADRLVVRLVPVGNTTLSSKDIVAVGKGKPGYDNTSAMKLYLFDEDVGGDGISDKPWTGSGAYDVYICLYENENDTNDDATLYKAKVTFSSATTTINASSFVKQP